MRRYRIAGWARRAGAIRRACLVLASVAIGVGALAISGLATGATTAKALGDTTASTNSTLAGLRTNEAENPLGIDTVSPRFSWRLATGDGQQQGLQVLVASSPSRLTPGKADIWDSGQEAGSEPSVDYTGAALRPFTRYYWTVRVWVSPTSKTAWADPAWFETAFTQPSQWSADWITRPISEAERLSCDAMRTTGEFREGACPPSPILRREFELTKPIASARLYATGLGWGVYQLNGERVGDLQMAPGFTHYDRRVFYNSFDVTSLLRQGANAIGVELGRGFYSTTEDGVATGNFSRASWHDEPKARVELRVTFTDGSTQVIGSDQSWKATTGPTLYDNIYRGETYDGARAAELAGWTRPGYDDGAWQQATNASAPAGVAMAQDIAPERTLEQVKFKSVSEPQPGVFVFDLGRNVSGWTDIRVAGQPGDQVKILQGSDLQADGTVQPAFNLYPVTGDPENVDTYRLAGTGQPESYHPQFAYRGFQYAQVTGWPGTSPPTLEDVTAEVVHDDLHRVGEFSSSNDLLNKILETARRTFEESAHAFPVGDPNSEKAGWMGDGQFVAPSWMWLLDTQRLYTKWSRDMQDSQADDGEMPEISPSQQLPRTGLPETGGDPALTGPTPSYDAALFMIPWEVYDTYGDRRPLEDRYQAMTRYLTYVQRWAPTDFLPIPCKVGPGECFGPGGMGDQRTPGPSNRNSWPDSNAWLYEMEILAARTAHLLGREVDAAVYEQRAASTRAQFNQAFLDPSAGLYRDPTEPIEDYSQTVNAEALQFGLVPDDLRQQVANSLAADIRARDYHLSTGATGTIFLWPALSQNGHIDEAVRTAEQETYPSFGHWLDEQGSTVLREDWEGGRPEMFKGSIVAWFFSDLAGIRPIAPGFAKIEFRPRIPGSGLDWARATFESVRGPVASAWQKDSSGISLSITVPPNASGTVYVPGTLARVSGANTGSSSLSKQPKLVGQSGDSVVFAVQPGSYRFRSSAQ